MNIHQPGTQRGIESINPANGEVLRRFEPHTMAEVQRRLGLAAQVFRDYRKSSFTRRAELLKRAADTLESEKQTLARTITLEMGKPIGAARQEVEKCALGCRFYAELGQRFLTEDPARPKEAPGFVRYEPLGPVLAVMPWNFPFWQVFRFAAPALMAGNVGLLKHASNVPQCALAIERLLLQAGFPQGAFQALLITSEQVQAVIEDPRVTAVTLTGSVGAGRKVAAAAGAQIKKTVLELGGSDPFIVMASADLDKAVETAVRARTVNNGQSCIAAKRFILERRIADDFEKRFVERMSSLQVGDPLDEKTDIGPLATGQVAADLQAQVDKTVHLGARLLLGGKRMKGPGFFFEPTVLSEIPQGSPAAGDELFGPVASLFRADGLDDALRIANDTVFGLGASAWTSTEGEKQRFIDELEAGLVFINGMVASHPALPFGGIKQSGYGRELGQHGIREFVNCKTVVVG